MWSHHDIAITIFIDLLYRDYVTLLHLYVIVYIVWSRHQVTMSLDVTVSHLGDHKSSVQSGNELHWCSVIFTQMLCPNYNLRTICWKFIFQVSKISLVIMSFKLNLEMNIVRIRAWGSVIFIVMLCHKLCTRCWECALDMCYELTMICIMAISVILYVMY